MPTAEKLSVGEIVRVRVLSSRLAAASLPAGNQQDHPAVPATPTRRKKPAEAGGTKPRTMAEPGGSLADRAYLLIEEMIMTGELGPNNFVSESGVSEHLGIGRTPVREALKRLEADGLVESIPSRGIRIAEVDIKQHLLMLEVRRQLERLLATRAARVATLAERKMFEDLAKRMKKAAAAADGEAFMRTDQEFNVLLDQTARNPVATKLMRPLRAMSRRFWFQNFTQQHDSLERGAKTHTAVMAAVAAGDVKAAGEATDALMDDVESFARSTLQV